MAGVLAGFGTGAATSALALSALSLLTSEHLPGSTPPMPPADEIRAAASPVRPDAAATAPGAPDANPYVRPGQGTGDAAAADTASAADPEPAAAPRAALEVAPPPRPAPMPAAAAPAPVVTDPGVTVRPVSTLTEVPAGGQVIEAGTPPAAPEPLPAPAAIPDEVAPGDAGPATAPDAMEGADAPVALESGLNVIAASPSEADAKPGSAIDAGALAGTDDQPDLSEGARIAADTMTAQAMPDEPSIPSGIEILAEPETGAIEDSGGVDLAGRTGSMDADAAPGDPPSDEGTAVQFKQVRPAGSGDDASPKGGVVTNRLPQIGAAPEAPLPPETGDPADPDDSGDAAPEAPGESAAPATPPDAAANDGRAVTANAAPFVPSGARPVMGVLLRDASPRLTPEELDALDLPVTFVVDVRTPDAAEAIAAYRAAGFEVALSADLPAGASAGDAETSVEDWLRRFPGAVAFVEGREGGLQGSPGAMRGVMARLVESGHGLVTYPRGLNAAQRMAGSEGVPAALIFRNLTGADSLPRLMDQAAFRASRESGVLVIGDATARNVEALERWAASSGGRRIQTSPASFVLNGGGDADDAPAEDAPDAPDADGAAD